MLRHPKFDHILSGCTSLRMLDLARRLQGGLLRDVLVRDIPVAEARAAREMLLIGSSVKVAPIVEWDRKPIGDGRAWPRRPGAARAAGAGHARRGHRPADRHSVLTGGDRQASGSPGERSLR